MWHHSLACTVLIAGLTAGLASIPYPASARDKGAARAIACAQKASAADAAICLDRDLVRSDAQVAEAYRQLRRTVPPRLFRPIDAEQRQWRIARNRCGAQMPCLATSYQNRLAVLEQALKNAASTHKGHAPRPRAGL